jgi:hypothetical protein
MKYPSWCCQRCGAEIGWIGRAWDFLGIRLHRCRTSREQIRTLLLPVRHTQLRDFSEEEAEQIIWEAADAAFAAADHPGKTWIDAASAVLQKHRDRRNMLAMG